MQNRQKELGLKRQFIATAHAHRYANLLLRFCSTSTSCWKVKLLKLFELTKRQQRAKWRRRCPRKKWIKRGVKSDKVNLCTTRYKQGCCGGKGTKGRIVETVAELGKRKTERHIRFKCISLLVDTSRFRLCRGCTTHFCLRHPFSSPWLPHSQPEMNSKLFNWVFRLCRRVRATIKFWHYFCLFSCWSIKYEPDQWRFAKILSGGLGNLYLSRVRFRFAGIQIYSINWLPIC